MSADTALDSFKVFKESVRITVQLSTPAFLPSKLQIIYLLGDHQCSLYCYFIGTCNPEAMFYVSITVNPPLCTRHLIKMMFLMLKYNYCCHPGIFKLTVLPKKKKKNCKADFFFFFNYHAKSHVFCFYDSLSYTLFKHWISKCFLVFLCGVCSPFPW